MAIDRPAKVRDELDNTFGYSNVISGDLSHVDADEVVSVRDDRGVEPISIKNGTTENYNRDGIRIVVRGKEDDVGGTRQRARDIMEDLDQHDITGFVTLRKQGGIFPLNRDEDGRPQFELNFIAHIKE